ncbi:hypothetical protein FBEOM_10665 [Fusarium beomiforme]|uniref:DUF7730 domain-containing protein n=1 Tax=Fusarium beomiforme TaxID=44412 RepID=A0A9P5DV39_9HYPO|nr:hypothetical protein FBEOM_10665 [Fusarium beomiforme]
MSFSPRGPDPEERERERNALWEARIKELPVLPDPRPRALTPDSSFSSKSVSASYHAPRPLYQESCFWFRVPPNIRRDILRLAFGDARIHIELEYNHPHIASPGSSSLHCGIVVGPGVYANEEPRVLDKTKPATWRWWSSKCHRWSPGETQGLGPMTRTGALGPWVDYCHDGSYSRICEAWKQLEGPLACHIGVMGWLLSCRQNYMETIDVLYSTNTLILDGSHMISRLPQLLLPRRLEAVTSLEVNWPFKTNCNLSQSYDELDKDHLNSIFDLLSPSQFPALRQLYIWFSQDEDAYLNYSGLEVYHDIVIQHLDSFAQCMNHLKECAFALPDFFYQTIHSEATEVCIKMGNGTKGYIHERSYRQVWRDINGKMTVVKLPYVDSYPQPPYHLPREDDKVAGYWILEARAIWHLITF